MALNMGTNKNKVAKGKRFQVGKDLYLTEAAHTKLLKHLKERLEFSKDLHDQQVAKFKKIDQAVYGYLVLDEDDEKRREDNEKGYGVKPVDTILPLTLTQLDEAVTYLIEVLSTDSGLYGAIAPEAKKKVADGFAALMNEHADRFKHLRALNLFLFNTMKYNWGGLSPSWKIVKGNQITNAITDTPDIKETVVYQGNELHSLDPYNTYYDISVSPIDLASEGEFFAEAAVKTAFKARKMLANEEIFNAEDIIKNGAYSISWYTDKPTIDTSTSNTVSSNFLQLLGGDNPERTSDQALEFVRFYIWLNTKEYDLAQEDKLQVCRVTMLNNERVVRLEVMNNAHALLPIGVSMPWEDGFKEATKSYGQLLNPFQLFASAQMNVHQKSNRKSLYGVTFFNKNVLDLGDDFDPVASKIPVNAAPDVDIRKAIFQVYDAPKTENTIRDIGTITEIMQKILPTDILKQVAGLERATQYQSAATVQGANRRNLKIARIIDIQALSHVRQIQLFNILQYQESVEIISPEGELIPINPAEFRETKIEFAISEGLRGLDRLSMSMAIQDVLNSIIQSQQASQQIDVVGIINYWTSFIGDKTDFSQFRFKSEMDKLPPQERDLAFQVYQQFIQAQQNQGTTQQ